MRSINHRAIPVALAVASGLATCGLLYTFLSGSPGQATVSLEPMIVTTHEVDDTKPLSAADIKVVQVLQRPAGAFTSVTDLNGRLPLVKIGKGEPVLSSHLAPTGTKPGLWHRIPPGKRAVTVSINEIVGVGGFLKPGQHVDVISVTRIDDQWHTRTVVQDLPILAVAQDDATKKEDRKAKVVPSVTLLASPEQAEKISLATEAGQIRLSLRAPNDHKLVKEAPPPKPKPKQVQKPAPAPQPVYMAPPPAPAAKPAAPKPAAPKPVSFSGIEVINGNSMEVVNP